MLAPSATAGDIQPQDDPRHTVGIHGCACTLKICTGSCSTTYTPPLIMAVVSILWTQRGTLIVVISRAATEWVPINALPIQGAIINFVGFSQAQITMPISSEFTGEAD